MKWAVELSEHHIDYQKELMTLEENPNKEGRRTLQIDGSSNFRGSGLGLVLTSPSGDKIEQSVRCGF